MLLLVLKGEKERRRETGLREEVEEGDRKKSELGLL